MREADFVMRLGAALHQHGVPADRLEEALARVARAFGLHGEFFATPTSLFATLEGDGESGDLSRSVRLVRANPGEVDLSRLQRLDRLMEEITRGRMSPEAAHEALDAILRAPRPYSRLWTPVAFTMASAAAARFFGGGVAELLVAGLAGAATGVLSLLASGRPRVGLLFEPMAAWVAATSAALLASFVPGLSVAIATLGGVIVLLPGFTVTVATSELASRHLVAGTTRLAGAALLFASVGLGVALAWRMCGLPGGAPPAVIPAALPGWTLVPALAAAPIAAGILFRSHPRELGWVTASGAIAFGGARLGSHFLGGEVGVFAGAVAVGVAANAYSRWRCRPALGVLAPGIMLLVPGGLGFRSVSSLLARDVVAGTGLAVTAVFVSVALAAGLLTANVLVTPRRTL